MKIFYKKDYFRVLEELNKTNGELEEEKEAKEFFIDKLQQEEKSHQACLNTIESLYYKMKELKDELRKSKNGRGGYTKEINKLKKEKAELEQKLADSMTDKYLVKKLKPGKKPNTLTMSVRGSSVQSNIVKNLYKE